MDFNPLKKIGAMIGGAAILGTSFAVEAKKIKAEQDAMLNTGPAPVEQAADKDFLAANTAAALENDPTTAHYHEGVIEK